MSYLVALCHVDSEALPAAQRCAQDENLQPEAKENGESLLVQVALLSGQELPPVTMRMSEAVRSLKQKLAEPSGYPVTEQRLLLDDAELLDEQSLADAGISAEVMLTLARVPKAAPKVDEDDGVVHIRVCARPAAPPPQLSLLDKVVNTFQFFHGLLSADFRRR